MLDNIFEIVWSIPAVLIAITFHEYSHGRMAYKLGDPTAAEAGRLTLNPLAHLDPIGTLMLLLFRFGWAKPVPVNFNRLHHPKRDMIYVSLAGPIANIVIAILFALILKLSYYFIGQITMAQGSSFFNLLVSKSNKGENKMKEAIKKESLRLIKELELSFFCLFRD